jgi:hypothetical protein
MSEQATLSRQARADSFVRVFLPSRAVLSRSLSVRVFLPSLAVLSLSPSLAVLSLFLSLFLSLYVMTLHSTSSPQVLSRLSMRTEYRLRRFGAAGPAADFRVVRLVRDALGRMDHWAVAVVDAVSPVVGLRWRG